MAGPLVSEMASSAVRSLRRGAEPCLLLAEGFSGASRKKGEDRQGKDISDHTPLTFGARVAISCATS